MFASSQTSEECGSMSHSVTLAMMSQDIRNFFSSIIISQDYNGALFIETHVTPATLEIRFHYGSLGHGVRTLN